MSTAGTRRVLYCVVPSDLAGELHDPLREYFRGDSGVSVVIDWRSPRAPRGRPPRRRG